jgi:hypothetical protein
MDGRVQLGFEFAKEIATQLITLSTGLLALTVTFTKDVLKLVPGSQRWWLMGAWVLHLVAIVFGVWALMGLTGTLMPLTPDETALEALAFGSNVRLPAAFQIISFALGTASMVVYGVVSLWQRS